MSLLWSWESNCLTRITTKQRATVQEERNQETENLFVRTLGEKESHASILDGAETVPCIAIDCVRLKSFDGRPKNRKEARDDWDDEQAVDQVEFVAIVAWQITRFEHL